jgi:hypothetical protein
MRFLWAQESQVSQHNTEIIFLTIGHSHQETFSIADWDVEEILLKLWDSISLTFYLPLSFMLFKNYHKYKSFLVAMFEESHCCTDQLHLSCNNLPLISSVAPLQAPFSCKPLLLLLSPFQSHHLLSDQSSPWMFRPRREI